MNFVFYYIFLFFIGAIAELSCPIIWSKSPRIRLIWGILVNLDMFIRNVFLLFVSELKIKAFPLFKVYKIITLPDSKEGIEKKEKLVSIYLTAITVMVALKSTEEQSINTKTILIYSLFLILIIGYFMNLGINNNKHVTAILGTSAAITFSYILTSLTQNSLLFWIVQFVMLALAITISLVQPSDREYSAVEDKEDEYELY